MYPHYHTHISTSSNTCIHFIEYVYSFHRTRISPLHYVGVYVYTGTINRSPTAADGLQQRCEQIAIYTRTPTKCLTNTPPGVGADSSRPYPCINKYTYPHYRIYVSTLSHTHIHIIKHVHSFHRIRIFTSPHTHFPSPLRGYLHICGHDKSDPYSCERPAIMLLTTCNNAANGLLIM